MFQEKATVTWNEKVSPSYFRLGLECGQIPGTAAPGQFLMLRAAQGTAPLLRRPFSIHRLLDAGAGPTGLELLYKVVGEGTRRLSQLRPGVPVDLLGPLGKGFAVREVFRRIILVAGGIGVAPLVFLASRLRAAGVDPAEGMVFIGGRTHHDLLCQEDFSRLGFPLFVTTDDGSAGEMCLVTHPMETRIRKETPDVIYACGPSGMLECVAGIAARYRIPCQVSIETMMACGMGACLGCAVKGRKTPSKYLHACLDGPVFWADDLEL